ncbi:MAG: Uma2 family endonuclease [Candidatus Eremiobacteraeota bacterium]|nr:Uma2 family endonuclease [Candidatus Eremiobacteraeota bacterium]
MAIDEIVLPQTKPETEWILGRAVRKVSPFRTHSLLQGKICRVLGAWAEGRGAVGPEWRFRIAPPGEIRRPLVPDVAYVSYARLASLEGLDLEAPPFAPDAAFEILSPGDKRRYVDHKIAVYLAGGAMLVAVVDPKHRAVELHDVNGAQTLREGDVIAHAALPGFALPLAELFRVLERPRPPLDHRSSG